MKVVRWRKSSHSGGNTQSGCVELAHSLDAVRIGHVLRPCSAAIGLGSHDLGVASFAAELYRAGLFPVVVFSGATSRMMAGRFPRGAVVHYREHDVKLGQ